MAKSRYEYVLYKYSIISLYTYNFFTVNKIEVSYTSTSEKTMAPHSSTLAWKIPWTEEPGRLWSMGSLRVGHD